MSHHQSSPPEETKPGATQSGADADLHTDIAPTSVADSLRHAVLRLIALQREMAYLVNDLSEVETVLSIQDAAVVSSDTLTLDTVRQELANAFRLLSEEHAAATASLPAKNQGFSLAKEYHGGEKTGINFVGRVGDVRVKLSIEIDRFETESGRTGRQPKATNIDGTAGVSGLWQHGL